MQLKPLLNNYNINSFAQFFCLVVTTTGSALVSLTKIGYGHLLKRPKF